MTIDGPGYCPNATLIWCFIFKDLSSLIPDIFAHLKVIKNRMVKGIFAYRRPKSHTQTESNQKAKSEASFSIQGDDNTQYNCCQLVIVYHRKSSTVAP